MRIDALSDKSVRLLLFLGCFFLANALIAEFIGVKIFSLEKVFGLEPLSITFFGKKVEGINLTAGVLLWPVVFIMTDVINEYFGRKGVRLFSYIAAGLIAYAFIMLYFAIHAKPADFWIFRNITHNNIEIKLNMELAFKTIFGQGNWIIIGSLVAFLIGQMVDVHIFHFIKKLTGDNLIWLRATGSTLISQFIDSFIVLFIAFYLPGVFDLLTVFALGLVGYLYKFVVAILLTPLIYLAHILIDRFLGEELANKLKSEAMHGN